MIRIEFHNLLAKTDTSDIIQIPSCNPIKQSYHRYTNTYNYFSSKKLLHGDQKVNKMFQCTNKGMYRFD